MKSALTQLSSQKSAINPIESRVFPAEQSGRPGLRRLEAAPPCGVRGPRCRDVPLFVGGNFEEPGDGHDELLNFVTFLGINGPIICFTLNDSICTTSCEVFTSGDRKKHRNYSGDMSPTRSKNGIGKGM